MKKILTMALIATLGLSGFANAGDESVEALTEVSNSNNRVKVILKEGLGKVRLEVLDLQGKKLHQQTVFVKNDVMVPYNLSELPVGQYQLKIEANNKGLEPEVAVFDLERKLTKEEIPLMAYRKNLDDDSIKLTVIGLDEPGVTVAIADRSGKKIFEEKIMQTGAFSKIYSFRNFKANDVSVQVTDAKGKSRIF
ncbi:DUF3244 domain-containing protein [Cecembia calidifontis]|jgi:hypothetical protein|uniref:Secreted protein (Por secretion system target) n=1 Tax=Cecembia calidifontis TaxID=1187080 RepID=A0A4Q7PCL5_9BACT|nr:DUF3244 domain-containing protein [Cecembia calidifontis]RZS97458.1 hypothetical protein BC751_3065 [Cecembia calidifontis]